MTETDAPHVLLCSRDAATIEAIEVSAAALEVPLRVTRDAADARAAWPGAALRLLGAEVAARWGPPAAGPAFVVGSEPMDLTRCSAELGLPVLPLPDQTGRLASAMAEAVALVPSRAPVVALLGASGGLGVTTLAASLVLLAARAGRRAVGVDLAEGGGGIDLVVGAEMTPGLRWADLTSARGEVGEVWDRLPTVAGAAFLAHSREAPQPPGPEAVGAVLGALTRTADLVVVDAGRGAPPQQSDRVLLMVGGDVRSVAAARMLATRPGIHPEAIVVRRGPGRGLPRRVVARSLGAECLGEISHDKALPRLSELGMAPVPGPARRFARQAAALLKELSDA